MYQTRFIKQDDLLELINLYHLARTALAGEECGIYERILYASKEFHKSHPEINEVAAYKDLYGQLHNCKGDYFLT